MSKRRYRTRQLPDVPGPDSQTDDQRDEEWRTMARQLFGPANSTETDDSTDNPKETP